MNTPVMGLRVAAVIFGLACLAQLSRLLLRVQVMLGSHHIPLWWSAVAALVLAALCAWMWRLAMPAKSASERHTATTPPSAVHSA